MQFSSWYIEQSIAIIEGKEHNPIVYHGNYNTERAVKAKKE